MFLYICHLINSTRGEGKVVTGKLLLMVHVQAYLKGVNQISHCWISQATVKSLPCNYNLGPLLQLTKDKVRRDGGFKDRYAFMEGVHFNNKLCGILFIVFFCDHLPVSVDPEANRPSKNSDNTFVVAFGQDFFCVDMILNVRNNQPNKSH